MHPGLILIGGNLVAVELPDEGGESWEDYSFSGIRVRLQNNAVKVVKFERKVPLQDASGKPEKAGHQFIRAGAWSLAPGGVLLPFQNKMGI